METIKKSRLDTQIEKYVRIETFPDRYPKEKLSEIMKRVNKGPISMQQFAFMGFKLEYQKERECFSRTPSSDKVKFVKLVSFSTRHPPLRILAPTDHDFTSVEALLDSTCKSVYDLGVAHQQKKFVDALQELGGESLKKFILRTSRDL